jgi:hypothetical protein
MSRGFLSSLGGIGMTLFAWFGPWAWPAWPAFTIIDLAFGTNSAFAELPLTTRAAVVTVLIAANVVFWAVAIQLLLRAALRIVALRRKVSVSTSLAVRS